MGKNIYEHQSDSIRFSRMEESLEIANKRISELESIVDKLSPLIKLITPEKQVIVETKYIPVKCEKRIDFLGGTIECRPIKQLNEMANQDVCRK